MCNAKRIIHKFLFVFNFIQLDSKYQNLSIMSFKKRNFKFFDHANSYMILVENGFQYIEIEQIHSD